MPNQVQSKSDTKYDLKERTARFGEAVIKFVRTLPSNSVNNPLVSQIMRSATSVGANYMEADTAESKKDFQHKIGLCKKESKETMHWFRMFAQANQDRKEEIRGLWKEVRELTLIFSKIVINSKNTHAI
ncbi:MAG: four helix bundle protein [Candidatus Brennerbacteria bacterium CG11_big_fil_rev_8_21_14_0_20_43_10]|uniref:Four helix bundle protein n=2 Tax=Candidatus Brenneribacteriota TaxID=1817902 RepID=A0A2H9N5K5_9BACT|nr:MAG: four helix bundle protein [Parcubacteria group bacterium CG1_02_44_31]PIP50377.1 MAG: four helix bundle protein [Candidatus Brennerbacteria bacterium CG23_combo_of_CG06-09_8_20_14_all_44_41]PIR25348.1 MAG: four helix bundle protein [Candidatus Brennerbacteria bacterium CG11_big_fil_rev_8_21_14_0_20_43_10]PIX29196.1 MAG: four helix bundle protein [Candidatus Brennerbacteria bacterium CG_4_8_14_3_um_filter_43_14]